VKRIAITHAEGQTLGRTVRDGAGNVLVKAGMVLGPRYINALVRRGFTEVYVADGLVGELDVEDALRDETRGRAYTAVQAAFTEAQMGGSEALREARAVVDDILDELMSADQSLISLSALRASTEYTFVHSVNVCALSLLIGVAQGLDRGDLRSLGLGALLHDVGMADCADLAAKPGALTATEWERIRRHPVAGFEMLRTRAGVHLFSAHIAFQHHERLDGSGYPRGLRAERILPFAKVVAVADAYDAMVAERPYRPAMPAHAAVAELLTMAGTKFDATVVHKLSRRLATYPNGAVVRLNTGELAAVCGQGTRPEHPVIRIVSDPRGSPVAPFDVPLGTDPQHRRIAEMLADWPAVFSMRIRELAGAR
jgi:HD-GYP domain-containing protein (c-di-GMP phosphodiesterase class II)